MSYTTLIARWQSWLEDSDAEFTGEMDSLVGLAEGRINKDINVDAMRELVTGNFTANSNELAKDTAIVAVRWLRVNNGSAWTFLDLRQTSWIKDKYPAGTATTGTPAEYAHLNEETILVGPTPATALAFEMETEQRIVGLSSTTETWLSTRHDSLLFYAGLVESGVFQKDPDGLKDYEALYQRELAGVQGEIIRSRMDARSLAR